MHIQKFMCSIPPIVIPRLVAVLVDAQALQHLEVKGAARYPAHCSPRPLRVLLMCCAYAHSVVIFNAKVVRRCAHFCTVRLLGQLLPSHANNLPHTIWPPYNLDHASQFQPPLPLQFKGVRSSTYTGGEECEWASPCNLNARGTLLCN